MQREFLKEITLETIAKPKYCNDQKASISRISVTSRRSYIRAESSGKMNESFILEKLFQNMRI